MSTDSLSSDIIDFIQRYINSLEELEILLMFCAEPQVSRTLTEVNEALRSSAASIRSRLEKLGQNGFLKRDEHNPELYHYHPQNINLDTGAQKLCVAYKERRLKVIEAIFSKPLAGIREFAEAFKIKGGKNE